MKKTVLLLFSLFTIHLFTVSQGCLPEGINFTTQEEIDNFQSNYPGCTEIDGNVKISGENIENLEGLHVITSIGGFLHLSNNLALTNFSGLESLTYVSDNLIIGEMGEGNPRIKNLSGIENLSYIGGNIKICDNDSLLNLSGLEQVLVLFGDLNLQDNPSLESLEGLNNVYLINGNLEIHNNDSFMDISGFSNLENIEGNFILNNNNLLLQVTGLNNLDKINGKIEITNNDLLNNLSGLENINSSSIDSLFIQNNSALSNCHILSICDYISNPDAFILIENNAVGCNTIEEIEEACCTCLPNGIVFTSNSQVNNFENNYPGCTKITGSVTINGGNAIYSLSGLSMITSIGGDLELIQNFNINSLFGLNSLESIGGGLNFDNNIGLDTINNLESLGYLGGDLTIQYNQFLVSMAGLEGLTEVNGNIYINSSTFDNLQGLHNITHVMGDMTLRNINVTSLSDLQILDTVYGNMVIEYCDELNILEGVNNIKHLEGNLKISHNENLQNLNGIESLESINGEIIVEYNDALLSLSGIDNINPNSIDALTFKYNPLLAECDIHNVCEFLSTTVGNTEIHNNALGCTTHWQIEEACENCLPEGITFYSQEQIDNFYVNHEFCTEIGGDVVLDGSDISNLNGLENIISIGGSLNISNNSELIDLGGLDELSVIGGNVEISNNTLLSSLTALSNLSSISGDILLFANENLTTLSGLDNIDAGSINNLSIYGNSFLSNCEAYSICKYLANPNGEIEIYNNASGCNNLEEITEACELAHSSCLPQGIIFNNQLEIDHFQSNYPYCLEVEGDISITGQDIITLSALDVLTGVGGILQIKNNDSLSSLFGLHNISSIGGGLYIYENNMLYNLLGLENLTSLGDFLFITNNNSLTNLSHLNNVDSIGDFLAIVNNMELVNISGLENIAASTIAKLQITDNPELSSCEINSVCDYLATPNSIVVIYNNAQGCNSYEEVEDACFVNTNEIVDIENKIQIFPNPAKDEITILCPKNIQINEVCIFSQTGKKIICRKDGATTFNISELEPGLYFMEVKTNSGQHREKLIIQ